MMAAVTHPPQHCQVLIIGAGPAGSYAAATLAREGLEVVVLEADKFPRYHIGESLIPSIRPYFRFIDAESTLANYGFFRKPGSAIKFNQYKHEGYTDFVALGCDNNAWNVVRSEFDHLLMSHARACGATVYEQTKVTKISFSETDLKRPTSVTWTCTSLSAPLQSLSVIGSTNFTYLIDASGRSGIISTRYQKDRHFNTALKNVAMWGYWQGTSIYGAGTARHGAPWFEALTDESGWAWFIPLHNGTTSVGIVMNQETLNSKEKCPALKPQFAALNSAGSTLVSRYLSALSLAPGLVDLITPAGILIQGSVKSASDFSYSAPSYAGDHYRIIGDAGAFIDPFFSSGIHLALTSALSAAATICACIRGDCSEFDAAQWHTSRVATSYTRFQVVVLSAYKQIRAQSNNVLSDIDEDNFDRAFTLLRPVIQGAADMGKTLSETELQNALDFCVNIFSPTSVEDHDRVLHRPQVGRELLDVTAPVMNPRTLDQILETKNTQAAAKPTETDDTDSIHATRAAEKMVLNKINARRVIHQEYAINNMETEPLNGYVMRLMRGGLGLVKAT